MKKILPYVLQKKKTTKNHPNEKKQQKINFIPGKFFKIMGFSINLCKLTGSKALLIILPYRRKQMLQTYLKGITGK